MKRTSLRPALAGLDGLDCLHETAATTSALPVLHERRDDVRADLRSVIVVKQVAGGSRFGELDRYRGAESRPLTSSHRENAIGKKQCFLDAVGDHHGRDAATRS